MASLEEPKAIVRTQVGIADPAAWTADGNALVVTVL